MALEYDALAMNYVKKSWFLLLHYSHDQVSSTCGLFKKLWNYFLIIFSDKPATG